jgi:hypothetical protein
MWSDVYFQNKISLKGKWLDAIIPSIKYFFQSALLCDSYTSYVCMYVRICVYMYLCMCLCIIACVYACRFVCMCVYVCMWQKTSPNLKPGDIALLTKNSTSPLHCPTAVITDIQPRANSIVLVVTLRNSKGILNVPLQKICLFLHVNSE